MADIARSAPPESIDDVISRLDEIVERSRADASRAGYFAALYRKVTVEVKKRIEDDFFDDGKRMQRLDVLFANRYLEAYEQARAGKQPTKSWQFAFDVSDEWWPIVLQHLLLGINAHINLDLGVAAVETVEPGRLPALRDDFNRINSVLADLTKGVYQELADIWTLLRLLGNRLGHVEGSLIKFSLDTARDEAWRFAERLAALEPSLRPPAIVAKDLEVYDLARVIRRPGVVLSSATKAIRLGERGTVREIIGILE